MFQRAYPREFEIISKRMQNYPSDKWGANVSILSDRKKCMLFSLSRHQKTKAFANYCLLNKVPMSSTLLEYYGLRISLRDFYEVMHGSVPTCLNCSKELTKLQLYSAPEDNSNRTCSKKCQQEFQKNSLKNKCRASGSDLVQYSSKYSTITCKTCRKELRRSTTNIVSKDMYECNSCAGAFSKGQLELNSLIGGTLEVRGLIDGATIDIVHEPSKTLVEYDGLMWHSFGIDSYSAQNNPNVDPRQELRRLLKAEELGYQMFRVWDSEYMDSLGKKKWDSVIQSKLGSTKRIHARKCKIIEVSSKEAKHFADENHLQGSANASARYGLEYEGELVALMTFGKSRYNKNVEWELIRFCSLLGTTVVGGASKLLKHFEVTMKPESLISYANRRWSQGNLYKTLGFEFIGSTEPNYWYFTRRYEREGIFSRLEFQKHKLKDKLPNFDPELTEMQNMMNNGYRVMYDCGNLKFLKQYG